ncbi:MAG: hypothetical protein C4583_03510 [Anaerolineaceae bacterium]|nr:MAG: hypothetical protein C4583_03510 [Anaerolineaceae bacterium]
MNKTITTAAWALFAFLLIGQIHIMVMLFSYPVGGGVLHEVFAYSDGGQFDKAVAVFLLNLSSASILGFFFCLFRFPAPWSIIATIATFYGWVQWHKITSFPYASVEFNQFCLSISPVIPIGVFLSSLAGRRVSAFFHKRREGYMQ